MMEIVLLKWDECTSYEDIDSLMDRFIPFVTPEKYKRLDRLRNREDLYCTVAADILARMLLCRTLKCSNNELVIHTHPFGKPYVEGDPVFFNISHAGAFIAVALDEAPIGIDIEQAGEWNMDVARLICSPRELELLANTNDSRARQELFFYIWTAKESVLKALGTGLSLPPSTFEIVQETAVPIQHNQLWNVDHNYVKQYVVPVTGYSMTVCAQHMEFAKQIEYITWEQLTHRFTKWVGSYKGEDENWLSWN
ncbi:MULTISPECIES: 4'-phosphopantetheinyl transferase family protein [Paenibacillus]|uniref:4'-phosphopantetheinyl transferase superfamily protein n=4 Tax=Paenibacillus TaxID=44249 RepID=A0ABT4EEP7_PAEAL|nr:MULTISPECIES: 4'-phosphopantetheinyl transferase superfamily protein [Paenibacillus]EPY12297.1 4'-phosphopantetheinyl transferase [Paenibacillus alvei A6-6i-x]MCY9532213.1 4'-phosphopantetheinyl transferase superfamily protein [Paenibacillus alvei]TQR42680.1 4'-phosphopantetheinyl transferase superfamily protein [Paenibacillus sp. SDF0028]SDE49530.1 4'-phosphopantetheinyl transferase [Paenibacillus sp. cl6col]